MLSNWMTIGVSVSGWLVPLYCLAIGRIGLAAILIALTLTYHSLLLLRSWERNRANRSTAIEKGLETAKLESKDQEARFRQAFDAISDFVLVKGPHSRLIWANRAFREYYGMTNDQLQGLIDAPFSPPDHTQQYVRDDLHVFTTGQTLNIPDEAVTRHDGVVRSFHTVKSPILNSSGRVVSTIGVSRDITERKEAERLIDSQRAMIAASAKMSALGQMAGGIAHEINNPLAIIHCKAEQLRSQAEKRALDPTQVAIDAQKIELTVERIATIVKSLKAFAREGESEAFSSTTLQKILTDTLELCRERFNSVELQLPDLSLGHSLECRAVQLSQVLLNLLNNACDAVQESDEKWVRIEFWEDPYFVKLSVTDSGKGVAPEIREKIMLPFFTTKPVGQGTGLGLSVSQAIMEAHQGSLYLDTHNKNSRFVVRLPKRR